ncbi:MAG: hypothetical protein HDS93_02150 [Bacteroidales bacterium]|nr:hypothetical protein [Bacteroidales bacterium]
MEEYIQTCKECEKDFLVRVSSMNFPGCKSREEIECPYCHADNGYRMTSGFVKTFKIDENR